MLRVNINKEENHKGGSGCPCPTAPAGRYRGQLLLSAEVKQGEDCDSEKKFKSKEQK